MVYFTRHQKDDSGGRAAADTQGIKDPPVKISQVIVTRHAAELIVWVSLAGTR